MNATNETYGEIAHLIEYYTKSGNIHFAWVLGCGTSNDARAKVKSLRNFSEVITCSREFICPLAVSDPKIIHFVH